MDPCKQSYEYLDREALKQVAAFEPREFRFNPSSMSKCSRQLAYKALGTTPEPVPGFLLQYGPWGDYAHDQVRFVMRDAGCDLGALEFDDDKGVVCGSDIVRQVFEHRGQTFTVSGRGDGRVTFDGEEHYLELKSVDAYKFRWIKTNFNKSPKAGLQYLREKYDSYIHQCNVMMKLLGLDKTYLVMINRSSCQFGINDKNFENPEGTVLKFDEDLWQQQLNKMATITRMVAAGELPMRGRGEGSKDCGQCAYENRCWGK